MCAIARLFLVITVSKQKMLGQAVTDDSLISLLSNVCFLALSQRNWEVKCPAFLLAEAGSQWLYH